MECTDCRKCIFCNEHGIYINTDIIYCEKIHDTVSRNRIKEYCAWFVLKGEKERVLTEENELLKEKDILHEYRIQTLEELNVLRMEDNEKLKKNILNRDNEILSLKQWVAGQDFDIEMVRQVNDSLKTEKKELEFGIFKREKQELRLLRENESFKNRIKDLGNMVDSRDKNNCCLREKLEKLEKSHGSFEEFYSLTTRLHYQSKRNKALERQLGRRDKKIKKLKRKRDNIANQMIDMTEACDSCQRSDLKNTNRRQKLSNSILRLSIEKCTKDLKEVKELNASMKESIKELTDLKYAFTELQETNENISKELTDIKCILSESQESERYITLDKLALEDKVKKQKEEIEQLARLSNVNVDTINEQNSIINRLLKE